MYAHGPRRRNAVAIPAACAGLTSLSSRFPTYRIASAGHPASTISRWKKLRRRLLHTPAVRRADHINRQVERAQDLLRLCRLVGREPDEQALIPQRRQARPGIGVQVLLRERLRLAGRCSPVTLGGEIEARLEVLERLPVVAATRDDRAEHCREGVPRNAEPVGPGPVLPCLVDECLAHVEEHRPQARHPAPCFAPPSDKAPTLIPAARQVRILGPLAAWSLIHERDIAGVAERALTVLVHHRVVHTEPPFRRYEYVVWFRDPTLPADDQDYEWPAVLIDEAPSAEEAKSWGDRLAKGRAVRAGEIYLRSTAEPYAQAPEKDLLPVVPYGVEVPDEDLYLS